MARSTTERLAEKTVERQFLYEMETDLELAPAASRAMLASPAGFEAESPLSPSSETVGHGRKDAGSRRRSDGRSRRK